MAQGAQAPWAVFWNLPKTSTTSVVIDVCRIIVDAALDGLDVRIFIRTMR